MVSGGTRRSKNKEPQHSPSKHVQTKLKSDGRDAGEGVGEREDI